MAINVVSVQYDGGFLLDIDPMLPTLGNPFNPTSFCRYNQCSHLNVLTFFLLTGWMLRINKV